MPRRLLVAGSVGPERVPARPGGDDPRWFEPLHVRNEAGARERIGSQVAAGADVIVAPTWLTHRRALLPLGETRSARAWTAAAIRVAREGLELGLERREEMARGALTVEALQEAPRDAHGATTTGATPLLIERPHPLVAAVLSALDEDAEPGSGRLLPREAATERDYVDQAGLAADAEPDLILVAGQRSLAELRLALEASRATGLPVWAAAGTAGSIAAPEEPARWLEACVELRAEAVLLPPPPVRALSAAGETTLRWGGLVRPGDDRVLAWLESGATLIGLLDGATAKAIEGPRAIIDELERHELERQAEAEGRWPRLIARAASMAPGGAALWHGAAPDGTPPGGFQWSFAGPGDAGRLPEEHFRFIVDHSGDRVALRDLGTRLERGGVLATMLDGPVGDLDDLRLLVVDEDDLPVLAILRRDA